MLQVTRRHYHFLKGKEHCNEINHANHKPIVLVILAQIKYIIMFSYGVKKGEVQLQHLW